MSYLASIEKKLRTVKRRVADSMHGPEIEPWPRGPHRSIELIYWRPEVGNNFGDELSRVVVELMLARRGMTAEDELPRRRRMLAIGSILHQAHDDTVVWGTGRNGVIPDRAHFFERLDVRAVRGPRTAEFLRGRGIAVPQIYGDPGLLLPKLVGDRFRRAYGRGPAFVPNLNDFRAGVDLAGLGIPLIDPRRSWSRVVEDILSYDLILASSLHGLVVAEAFGIPARYVRLSSEEATFKYEDYHEGTGRSGLEWATSIEQGLEMGGQAGLTLATDGLENAFPYDIWSGGGNLDE